MYSNCNVLVIPTFICAAVGPLPICPHSVPGVQTTNRLQVMRNENNKQRALDDTFQSKCDI